MKMKRCEVPACDEEGKSIFIAVSKILLLGKEGNVVEN
jgi:hypothetical protein